MGCIVGGESLGRLKNEGLQMILIAIVTAIAGEFKITPFSGEVFRIGLGSSAFLLCLLLMRHLPYIYTGIITGITVLLFRTLEDGIISHGIISFSGSVQTHLSAAFYYIAFAMAMSLIKPNGTTSTPLYLDYSYLLLTSCQMSWNCWRAASFFIHRTCFRSN